MRALAEIGVRPGDVNHIIVSHLHYDHIGNLAAFPAATLIVARPELEFWSGSGPQDAGCDALAEPDEITFLQGAVRQGRAKLIDGDAGGILPGIDLRLVGGHTPGQLVISVRAGASRVVLTSEAVHFYEEMQRDRPHRLVLDLPAMRAAYAWLRAQARDGALVITGTIPRWPAGSRPWRQRTAARSCGSRHDRRTGVPSRQDPRLDRPRSGRD